MSVPAPTRDARRDLMMVDHYAVGAHGTCKPDRLEIESAAIERKKNLCIGVFGNSALWYAVSFVSGRNYNH